MKAKIISNDSHQCEHCEDPDAHWSIDEKEFSSKPSLDDLQKLVGGLIEYVQGMDEHGKAYDIVINEEGKLLGLPFNPIATMMFRHYWSSNGAYTSDFIAGNAVIMDITMCDILHICLRCKKNVYCKTYVWACPWINGDEDQFCKECLDIISEELNGSPN